MYKFPRVKGMAFVLLFMNTVEYNGVIKSFIINMSAYNFWSQPN